VLVTRLVAMAKVLNESDRWTEIVVIVVHQSPTQDIDHVIEVENLNFHIIEHMIENVARGAEAGRRYLEVAVVARVLVAIEARRDTRSTIVNEQKVRIIIGMASSTEEEVETESRENIDKNISCVLIIARLDIDNLRQIIDSLTITTVSLTKLHQH